MLILKVNVLFPKTRYCNNIILNYKYNFNNKNKQKMDLKSDSNYKSEILDIIKSLKVNGSFDQFRKDCFAEILTQVNVFFKYL